MKENHVLLFRRLTRSTLGEVLQKAESAKSCLMEQLRVEYEDKLPGEYSYAQVDLTTLLLSNVPADLLSEKVRLTDQKLFSSKYLGRFGKVKAAEDLGTPKDSKISGNLKITFASNVQAALSLMAVATLHLSGNMIIAMYPYKVVSKKNNRPTTGSLAALTSVVIPVNNKEEYNIEVQLGMMAEVLLQNKAKVVDLIEADLEDARKVQAQEFPSIVRMMQEHTWLHNFIKDYHATLIDEYEELMDLISAERGWPDQETPLEITPLTSGRNMIIDEPDSEDWPDMIRQRNNLFINGQLDDDDSTDEKLITYEETSDRVSIFDHEFVCLVSFDLLSQENYYRPDIDQIESPQNKKSTSGKKSSDNILNLPKLKESRARKASVCAIDYNYYEYRIEKVSSLPDSQLIQESVATTSTTVRTERHKKSRDEHFDIEISTKSEEVIEDVYEEPLQPIKAEETIEESELMEDPSQPESLFGGTKQSRASRRKSKKLKNQVEKEKLSSVAPQKSEVDSKDDMAQKQAKMAGRIIDVKSIEPKLMEAVLQAYDPQGLKERAKIAEKLKRDSKDVLREQLAKIVEADNLDQYEKVCIAEMNSLDSLSKKMKQKARKRLRASINQEKVKRNIAIEQLEDECDDDEFEDDDSSVFENYINYSQYFPEADLRNIADVKLLLNQRFQKMVAEARTTPGKKKGKQEASNEKGGVKWKQRLTCSMDRMEEELSYQEEKIQIAETLNDLFRHFKDNNVKSLLNILHENSMAIKETITLQRREKVVNSFTPRKPDLSFGCLQEAD